ncbi:MAG: recombinase family protein, partial [Candidatus Thiodiazotropha sp.]
MNAMLLLDLTDKARRGLRGRVENDKSGSGISYGYRVSKMFYAQGQPIKGERKIYESQAAIVRRIFKEDVLENISPKNIADRLNAKAIPSPSGKGWTQSTINGNRRRRTGILNNELYIDQIPPAVLINPAVKYRDRYAAYAIFWCSKYLRTRPGV